MVAAVIGFKEKLLALPRRGRQWKPGQIGRISPQVMKMLADRKLGEMGFPFTFDAFVALEQASPAETARYLDAIFAAQGNLKIGYTIQVRRPTRFVSRKGFDLMPPNNLEWSVGPALQPSDKITIASTNLVNPKH